MASERDPPALDLPAGATPRIVRPLLIPSVALLWGGLMLSAVGDQLYAVALAWIGVAVLGPRAGYLTALQFVVVLLALLGIGRWADRWDRCRSMLGADLARALVLLAMVSLWLAYGGASVLRLAAVIVVLAVGEAVFRPALQTLLPTLIEDPRLLPAANGLFDATERSARLLGPGLVALVAAFLPVIHFLTLDAVSFLCSAAAIAMIGRRHRKRAGIRDPRREDVARRIGQGIRAMRGHPLLRFALATTAPLNGAWYAVFFLGLPLLIQQHHITGLRGSTLGAYGAVISSYGSTNLIATVIIGSRTSSARPQVQMNGGTVIVGLGIILIGISAMLPPGSALICLMISAAFSAIGGPMKDIPFADLRQTRIARHDLAAAVRAHMAAGTTGVLVALLLASFAFVHAGVIVVITACGAATVLIGAVGLFLFAGWTEEPLNNRFAKG